MPTRLHHLPPSTVAWKAVQQTWDVCLVLGGAAAWRYRNRQHMSEVGTIRLKEPGEAFVTERVLRPTGYLILQVEPDHFAAHAPRTRPARRHLTCAQLSGAHAAAAARWLHAAVHAGSLLERDERALPLIHEVLLAHVEAPGTSERDITGPGLRRAREFLAANFRDEVPLHTLARVAEMHEVSLVRAFRRAFGRPPHQLQIDLRVRAARLLLGEGAGGADVAAQVGFHDQSHLTRHFKRIVGISPGRYASTIVAPRQTAPSSRSTDERGQSGASGSTW